MSAPCPGIPARLIGSCLTAGLLAREYAPIICLPAMSLSQWHGHWPWDDRQSAYSCGGSHGFGPCWVVLTVFPINPLGVILGEPSRTVTVSNYIASIQKFGLITHPTSPEGRSPLTCYVAMAMVHPHGLIDRTVLVAPTTVS